MITVRGMVTSKQTLLGRRSDSVNDHLVAVRGGDTYRDTRVTIRYVSRYFIDA